MSSEPNPKHDLINAIQNFIAEHKKQPLKAKLSRDLATDFCKLGRNELGDLSQELFLNGPDALTGKIVCGVTIEVASVSEEVNFIELE